MSRPTREELIRWSRAVKHARLAALQLRVFYGRGEVSGRAEYERLMASEKDLRDLFLALKEMGREAP